MKLVRTVGAAMGCLVLFACGTPGAPRPPSLQLPRPVQNLAAARKGDKVTLTWTTPTQNTDGTLMRRPGPTRACRGINDFPLGSCPQSVADLPTPAPLKTTPRPQDSYVDTLPVAVEKQFPTGMATYALEIFNQRGRTAGLSNQVQVPLAPAPPAPGDMQAQVTAEGVAITGLDIPPVASVPGVSFAYHLYRRAAESAVAVDLGRAPVENTPAGGASLHYLDRSVEWQKTYLYYAAAVVTVEQAGKPLAQFQGDDSPVVKVFVQDVFPPARPVGLQAVSSGVGQKPFIDLTWASNQEPDLAGYNIYRRENGGAWTRLNRELVPAPAFRDSDVTPGATYYYTVSAVDLRGNQSQRSEETSETVPKT